MSAKPIEIKRIRGTANSTRERRKSEIQFPGQHNELTPAPDHLTPEGKALWDVLIKQLATWGLNFPTVYEYVAIYCELYELREETIKYMAVNGNYTIVGKTKKSPGIKRKSLEYKDYQHLTKKMILIGSKLGFSPEDISKIK